MTDLRALAQHSARDCDRAINKDRWTMSGYRVTGDTWTCPCGLVYVHECDEAEGCAWYPRLPR